MSWLANTLYLFAGLLYLPVALYHALILRKNRRGWGERFGFVPEFDPGKRRIWIHGVSLGEINATPRLAEALKERCPDIELVFSTTTDTGYVRAVQLYGAQSVFRFPLDLSFVVSRVLKRVNPMLIVLMELEVWYNLVRIATLAGIPVVVANGRLTARSARRFRWLGRAARSMFSDLAWVGAQDETIASRFRAMGVSADRVEVTSSLKWDSAAVTDQVEGAAALAEAMRIDGSRSLWVCGSTGPGEEAVILDAYRQILDGRPVLARGVHREGTNGADVGPILAIVPRKPERFDEVARIIERSGFVCVRRSEHDESRPVASWPEHAVLLGDTMGELRKFYLLADIVFIGRTLVPLGGSDPMEVAALGKPVVVGPHTGNFELPVRALGAAGAIWVVGSARELAGAVSAILHDKDLARELGTRARRVVLDNQGATKRAVEAILRVLPTRGQRNGGRAPADIMSRTGPA
jgi:3-deoxy-D-manno-octulosonic-acid transferase